jgi:hypothetical protein
VPGEDPADRFTYNFGVLGLRVLSSTPSGSVQGVIDHVRLTFNEAADPSTFTPDKVVSFTGPSGAIAVTGVSAVDDTDTVFDVSFAAQTRLGNYTMVVGPNIADFYGNLMDQNNNLITGEIPGDQYTAQFSLVLLVNGDFETGTLAGWTLVGSGTSISTHAHTGRYAVAMGPLGRDDTLSQTISTVAGHTYQFSFWEASDGGSPNDFSAKFGSTTVFSVTNESAHGYVQHTFNVTATGTSTVIQFAARNDPAYDYLDDVVVIDITGGGASGPAGGGGAGPAAPATPPAAVSALPAPAAYAPAPSGLGTTARTVPAAGEVGNLDRLFAAGRGTGVTYLPGFAAAVDDWADPLVHPPASGAGPRWFQSSHPD